MKKLLYILFVLLMLSSCEFVVFDDINDFKGNKILKIELDTTRNIHVSKFWIQDTINGRYNMITLRPEYEEIFHVGDTF